MNTDQVEVETEVTTEEVWSPDEARRMQCLHYALQFYGGVKVSTAEILSAAKLFDGFVSGVEVFDVSW